MIGEVLIHCVGIAVVTHVVPAEQHLSGRSAVHKNDSGFSSNAVVMHKQLTVHRRAVPRLEHDRLRSHELRQGKIGGHRTAVEKRAMRTVHRHHSDARRLLRAGGDKGYAIPARSDRTPLNRRA